MTRYAGRHRPSTRAERRAALRRARPSGPAWVRRGAPAVAVGVLALTGVAVGGPSPAVLDGLGDVPDEVHSAAAPDRASTPGETLSRVSRDLERAHLSEAETERADALARMEESSRAEARTRREAAEAAPEWVVPVAGAPFTSGYGERWGRLHAGNDYGVDVGTPVRSMADGTVVAAGAMAGYGIRLDIEYADGTVSRYGHLTSVSVDEGDEVARGDVVAASGNTGHSTGPHLHLEIRPGGGDPVDPSPWLREHGLDPS